MLIIAVASAKYVEPKVVKTHTAAVNELLTKFILPVKKDDRLNGRIWRYENLYTPEIEKYWNQWLNVKDGPCMLKKLTVGDHCQSDAYESMQTFDQVNSLLLKCKIKVSSPDLKLIFLESIHTPKSYLRN